MLVVDGISVSYDYYDESCVLSQVSLDVAPGRVACLLGRNGAGKTTLLKTIMGVLRPRKGTVSLDGVDITRSSPSDRARAGIGYVPQGRGIFPYLTVRENLLMGFEALTDKAFGQRSALESALDEMFEQFPVLKRMQSRAAGTLSGGQQQQLALARVLLRRPTVLLLDEPTEGIQPSIMHEIGEVIRTLGQTKTMGILLVEQFLDFALGVSNEYYVMDNGAIAQKGNIEEFDYDAVKESLAV